MLVHNDRGRGLVVYDLPQLGKGRSLMIDITLTAVGMQVVMTTTVVG